MMEWGGVCFFCRQHLLTILAKKLNLYDQNLMSDPKKEGDKKTVDISRSVLI
jgi:hypothetical protein